MPPKVVISLITDQNDFQLFQAEDARQTAAKEGLEVEIAFAENNAIQQITQLFRHIHAPVELRPTAVVVEPVSEAGMGRAAQNAVQAGIGWILINRHADYVDDLQRKHPSVPVCSVRIDQVEVGRLQGEQYRRLLPSGGQLLYVEGPDTLVAQQRREGMLSVIERSEPKIQYARIHGDWTAEGAEKAFRGWWRLKAGADFRVDLVGCQNDAMAMGIRRVTRGHPDPAVRAEWAHTLFTGVDGLPQGGQRMVAGGELSATIIGPSNTGPALKLVADFVRSRRSVSAAVVQSPRSYPPLEKLGPTR